MRFIGAKYRLSRPNAAISKQRAAGQLPQIERFVDQTCSFVTSQLRYWAHELLAYGYVCECIRRRIGDPMPIMNSLLRISVRTSIARLILICLLGATMQFPAAAQSDEAEASPSANIIEAREALTAWIDAYQVGEYADQWRLTHPRIRRWRPRRLWNRVMRNARRTNGALLSYTIAGEVEVTAEQLPCSEQGHCYRPGIDYVLFTLRTEYGNAVPPQPEYVAMALLGDQWLFGGGTLLNRPFGETSVIMTESDERRYRPRLNR